MNQLDIRHFKFVFLALEKHDYQSQTHTVPIEQVHTKINLLYSVREGENYRVKFVYQSNVH